MMRFSRAHSSAVLGGGAFTISAINLKEAVNLCSECLYFRQESFGSCGAYPSALSEQLLSNLCWVI